MPDYEDIPSREQWLGDCSEGLDAAQVPFLGEAQAQAMLGQDHVLSTVVSLLSDLDDIREVPAGERAFREHLTAAYLHEATDYWLEKAGQAPKRSLGGDTGGPRATRFHPEAVTGAVKALREASRSKLRGIYDFVKTDDREEIRNAIVNGVGLPNSEAEEDERRREASKQMEWLSKPEDRFRYKLRFRKGRAYRLAEWDRDSNELSVEPFTTTVEESEQGDRKTHFVMDEKGRIYCGYPKQKAKAEKFFHSSFVGGAAVLSAGMMQIENGQIRLIANSSGHYKPDGRHMAAVLQRLRLYGVPVANIRVEHYDTRTQHDAHEVLRWNGWPQKG